MDNKIDVSVDGLIKYGDELESAVNGFMRALEKEKVKNGFSGENIERMEDACRQLQNLSDCLQKVAIDYRGLEKCIIDALLCI